MVNPWSHHMQIFLLETLLKAKKKRLVHILILHIYPILTNFVTQEKKNGYFVYQSLCNNIVRIVVDECKKKPGVVI